LISFPTRIG